MKSYRVSLADVLERNDGPFWDRIKSSAGWPAFEAKISSALLEKHVEEWGEKCPDYEPGCPACEAWRLFETGGK